ncbi:hypothetical protein Q8F55_007288 [Vanrija albida]|uniref:Calpain catalytic domain-containing protein n=1 Tax=Vanrija albida TaxID=181172 RepID=A0ABR3PZW8_9TREE
MRFAALLPLLLATEGLASAIPQNKAALARNNDGKGYGDGYDGKKHGDGDDGYGGKKGGDHDHDGKKGDWDGDSDGDWDGKKGGCDCDRDGKKGGWDGGKGHGGKGHGGKGHDHDDDWHGGGHGHGHDGDHGSHGDKDCPPKDTDGIVKWILDNPVVRDPVIKLPESINNGGTLSDLVNNGTIPTSNTTAELLDGKLPANLYNTSTPATSFAGLNVTGANSTFTPYQGTNKNAIVFPGGPVRVRQPARWFERFHKRQQGVFSQPDPPTPNPAPGLTCNYAYEHVLGGAGTTAKGALWAIEGYVNLVAADVHQGGIGDCGMGAAIMALAAGGWTRYITNMFVKQDWSGTDRNIKATFKKDGVTSEILIDDQLPVLQNFNPNCWPYPGFQPVNDAAYPDLSVPTPIFFMPLFEKAFAKFLDANPTWKSTKPEVVGYEGLEGVNPAYVLAAVTGGTPKSVWRTKDGFDGPIIYALITCMRGLAPCAISTTNSTTLEGLGTPKDGSIWLNPAGSAAVPGGYVPGETSGLMASDAPTSRSTYTVIDFDQVQKTPQGDRSTAITMVGNHAYAFEWQASTHVPITEPMVDWDMRILNPWGSNPCQWPGGCGGGGAFDEPARVTTSFRSFAQNIIAVFTVENMPVL